MTPDSEQNNFVDLGADTQGFENSHIDDVSPNSSCPKKRNKPSSEIRPTKKRENEKQFLMLKTLPVERKKRMVLMFISPRA
ncbi:hypothetical protein L3X38_010467 [Prunus dulcis]|uniref:Uncharacterized protein n=1 Tax=Prunus dulcis TaxID=3755 RepID=A0AAD4ZDC0_PRUDU|nr:hypothetical protein L3X38_010467 [Prunus dulcis]